MKLQRLLALRRFIRRNQTLGMIIEKSDYANGWKIKHTSSQWTLFTIYLDGWNGFSFYHAIPDIDKGYDCADEKLIIQTSDLGILRFRWDAAWHRFTYGTPQNEGRTTADGKMMQSFAEWPRGKHETLETFLARATT